MQRHDGSDRLAIVPSSQVGASPRLADSSTGAHRCHRPLPQKRTQTTTRSPIDELAAGSARSRTSQASANTRRNSRSRRYGPVTRLWPILCGRRARSPGEQLPARPPMSPAVAGVEVGDDDLHVLLRHRLLRQPHGLEGFKTASLNSRRTGRSCRHEPRTRSHAQHRPRHCCRRRVRPPSPAKYTATRSRGKMHRDKLKRSRTAAGVGRRCDMMSGQVSANPS